MRTFSLEDLKKRKGWKKAVIVFKPESFDKDYSVDERSYVVKSDENYFKAGAISNSLYGTSLALDDIDCRLDLYIHATPEDNLGKPWIVDYCYILK